MQFMTEQAIWNFANNFLAIRLKTLGFPATKTYKFTKIKRILVQKHSLL